MKTLISYFRPAALLMALPAVLAFSACSKDDEPVAPAPDQAKVLVVHAAAGANLKIQALANTTDLGQLEYGTNTNYSTINAGNNTFKINVVNGGQTVATQDVLLAKDKSYSVFAYTTGTAAVALNAFEDDLAAPAAGTAKIRIVHMGQNAPSPVKLSQQTINGATDLAGVSAAFGSASAFAAIPTGTYNLLVTTGPASTTVVTVGDGNGNPTANKTYEAGKIYTVLVRGILGNINPALQPKAVIIQNN
ncbi:DUF4397 domain-containing protein [Hymenobacter rubripertinctus]|uniref:DUF4397 domain-containing protein n=1 Tax=Hymenobacter rubripertinctus TaxID=2029981 RepID=A0A418R9E3_9BACT|nr:DUF4397 domain-containing protein [Hymenobacter rubripertinctus]RIY14240.1 DUF4397 domain-containing protein [Hymenobacter rubripertinctus]